MGYVTRNVNWGREIRRGPTNGAVALSLQLLLLRNAPQTLPAGGPGESFETVSNEICPCFWEGCTA